MILSYTFADYSGKGNPVGPREGVNARRCKKGPKIRKKKKEREDKRERREGWTVQMDLRGFKGTGSNMVVSSSFGVGLFQAR